MLFPDTQTYVFDGSFYGLLSAVFESYERKHKRVKLLGKEVYEPGFFSENLEVATDTAKAIRVWNGLKQKISPTHQKHFYSAFLSEQGAIFQHLFDYAHYIFDHPKGYDNNYGHEAVLAIAQMSQKVHREKHRMEAFIRFKKGNNGLFFALINPDYNVIPLITRHFKNRYADQAWIIYDEKRKYGIHYDLQNVHEVQIDFRQAQAIVPAADDISLDEKEELYTLLWKDYFKSTNIEARRNMKLHIQHVPKRYWRYLTEKEDAFW